MKNDKLKVAIPYSSGNFSNVIEKGTRKRVPIKSQSLIHQGISLTFLV